MSDLQHQQQPSLNISEGGGGGPMVIGGSSNSSYTNNAENHNTTNTNNNSRPPSRPLTASDFTTSQRPSSRRGNNGGGSATAVRPSSSIGAKCRVGSAGVAAAAAASPPQPLPPPPLAPRRTGSATAAAAAATAMVAGGGGGRIGNAPIPTPQRLLSNNNDVNANEDTDADCNNDADTLALDLPPPHIAVEAVLELESGLDALLAVYSALGRPNNTAEDNACVEDDIFEGMGMLFGGGVGGGRRNPFLAPIAGDENSTNYYHSDENLSDGESYFDVPLPNDAAEKKRRQVARAKRQQQQQREREEQQQLMQRLRRRINNATYNAEIAQGLRSGTYPAASGGPRRLSPSFSSTANSNYHPATAAATMRSRNNSKDNNSKNTNTTTPAREGKSVSPPKTKRNGEGDGSFSSGGEEQQGEDEGGEVGDTTTAATTAGDDEEDSLLMGHHQQHYRHRRHREMFVSPFRLVLEVALQETLARQNPPHPHNFNNSSHPPHNNSVMGGASSSFVFGGGGGGDNSGAHDASTTVSSAKMMMRRRTSEAASVVSEAITSATSVVHSTTRTAPVGGGGGGGINLGSAERNTLNAISDAKEWLAIHQQHQQQQQSTANTNTTASTAAVVSLFPSPSRSPAREARRLRRIQYEERVRIERAAAAQQLLLQQQEEESEGKRVGGGGGGGEGSWSFRGRFSNSGVGGSHSSSSRLNHASSNNSNSNSKMTARQRAGLPPPTPAEASATIIHWYRGLKYHASLETRRNTEKARARALARNDAALEIQRFWHSQQQRRTFLKNHSAFLETYLSTTLYREEAAMTIQQWLRERRRIIAHRDRSRLQRKKLLQLAALTTGAAVSQEQEHACLFIVMALKAFLSYVRTKATLRNMREKAVSGGNNNFDDEYFLTHNSNTMSAANTAGGSTKSIYFDFQTQSRQFSAVALNERAYASFRIQNWFRSVVAMRKTNARRTERLMEEQRTRERDAAKIICSFYRIVAAKAVVRERYKEREALRTLRHVNEQATLIQSIIRMGQGKNQYLAKKKIRERSAITVQCAIRRFNAQQLRRMLVEDRLTQEAYDALIGLITSVQANVRGFVVRARLLRERRQTKLIGFVQRIGRGHFARQDLRRNQAAITIQRAFFLFRDRSRFLQHQLEHAKFAESKRLYHAAAAIQNSWRKRLFRQELEDRIWERSVRNKAAAKIQHAAAPLIAKCQLRTLKQKYAALQYERLCWSSATLIAATFRGYIQFQRYSKIRKIILACADLIARVASGYRERKNKIISDYHAHKRLQAALVIQNGFREATRRAERKQLLAAKRAMALETKRRIEASIIIQRNFRMMRDFRAYNKLKRLRQSSAEIIQLYSREKLSSLHTARLRCNRSMNRCAFLIQRVWIGSKRRLQQLSLIREMEAKLQHLVFIKCVEHEYNERSTIIDEEALEHRARVQGFSMIAKEIAKRRALREARWMAKYPLPVQEDAILSVQKVVRGFIGRRRVKKMRREEEEGEEATGQFSAAVGGGVTEADADLAAPSASSSLSLSLKAMAMEIRKGRGAAAMVRELRRERGGGGGGAKNAKNAQTAATDVNRNDDSADQLAPNPAAAAAIASVIDKNTSVQQQQRGVAVVNARSDDFLPTTFEMWTQWLVDQQGKVMAESFIQRTTDPTAVEAIASQIREDQMKKQRDSVLLLTPPSSLSAAAASAIDIHNNTHHHHKSSSSTSRIGSATSNVSVSSSSVMQPVSASSAAALAIADAAAVSRRQQESFTIATALATAAQSPSVLSSSAFERLLQREVASRRRLFVSAETTFFSLFGEFNLLLVAALGASPHAAFACVTSFAAAISNAPTTSTATDAATTIHTHSNDDGNVNRPSTSSTIAVISNTAANNIAFAKRQSATASTLLLLTDNASSSPSATTTTVSDGPRPTMMLPPLVQRLPPTYGSDGKIVASLHDLGDAVGNGGAEKKGEREVPAVVATAAHHSTTTRTAKQQLEHVLSVLSNAFTLAATDGKNVIRTKSIDDEDGGAMTTTTIDLENLNLSEREVLAVLERLKGTRTIKRIYLGGNNIRDSICEEISAVLESNGEVQMNWVTEKKGNIREKGVVYSDDEEEEKERVFSNTLDINKDHQNIVKATLEVFRPTIEHLSLANTFISDAGASQLAYGISKCSSLMSVDLEGTNVSQQYRSHIASILNHRRQLKASTRLRDFSKAEAERRLRATPMELRETESCLPSRRNQHAVDEASFVTNNRLRLLKAEAASRRLRRQQQEEELLKEQQRQGEAADERNDNIDGSDADDNQPTTMTGSSVGGIQGIKQLLLSQQQQGRGVSPPPPLASQQPAAAPSATSSSLFPTERIERYVPPPTEEPKKKSWRDAVYH